MDITPIAKQATWPQGKNICSKTDLKGNITYINRAFMKVTQLHEGQLLGQPHNIIRHPDMPKGFFRHMWQELEAHHEFTGIIKNITSMGEYYWSDALINATDDGEGNQNGFFSVRREASQELIEQIEPIYKAMLEIEKPGTDESINASVQYFLKARITIQTSANKSHDISGVTS
ncbi:PAS domain S-box protein [Bermanella marisrubri]|uniref:Aerotaxis receptor n=1 Tax=Bermanella marisrubri TaxID=207949 RepID=Q1N3C3_9GAMM|nr:PAS domain-containing protein [Bermanella marisrubri]EAT12668.1 aerotaxis receptor [Oceanobacter sp. RED65] [Bermanella marisrubri]QIZ85208.1 PAS domain S-box protein [Bermanella marisrubri]